MDKNEIIADLLCIRGTLSLINDNYNEIKTLKNEYEQKEKEFANNVKNASSEKLSYERSEDNYRELTKKLSQKKIDICKATEKLENLEKHHLSDDELKKRVKKEKFSKIKVDLDKIKEFSFVGMVVCFLISFFIYGVLLGLYDEFGILELAILFHLGIGILGYPIIYVIYRLICCASQYLSQLFGIEERLFKQYKSEYATAVAILNKKITTLRSDIAFLEKEIEKCLYSNKRLAMSSSAHDLIVTNSRNELNKFKVQTQNKMLYLKQGSVSIYNKLVSLFSPKLSVLDWPYIDLIIFYLETGRADDLKEALNKVDAQKQTDQIAAAIKAMGNSISSQIQSSFNRLESTISQNFARISYQLDTLNDTATTFNQNLSKIGEKIDMQNKYLSINNSLLKNSNKSMKELLIAAKEMKDIKIDVTVNY